MRKYWFGKTLSLLIILLLIIASFFPVSLGSSSKEKDIDDDITSLLENAKIPSMSACIIKNESLVWYNGYGKYNKLLGLTPSENTVYMAASVSKSFTATAIMQLYERGLFELEEDVSNHLPFVLRNPKYPDVPITFKMLLSHQSSLPMTPLKDLISFGIVYLFFPKNFPYPVLEWHLVPGGKLYREDVWTDNKPGYAFNYSNMGYLILEYLVEQISGESFDNYCKDNIFTPLDMKNSSFYYRDIKRMQRAVPYILRRNFHLRLPFYDVPKSGAGGLVTSTEDLSHFLIAHMNNGTYNGVRILDNSTVELMHTIYYENPNSGVLNFSYGFGWMFLNINGTIYQGHDGDAPGFAARMIYCKKNKTGIIFLFNRTRRNIEDLKLSNELIEMLFAEAKNCKTYMC